MMINNENITNNQLNSKQVSLAKQKSNKEKTIEETYTKKSQLEHILLRPDTYVGSVEKHSQSMWVLDRDTKQVVFRPCNYVPGLYKIFDEIIVNAADNKQRDPSMNRIEVTINEIENSIRVWNNGSGIPVAIHAEHGIYVPELIFGNLLTGSNFDDEEAKTTGGRNGYGAKLANIFSTKFIVETSDKSRGLKYRQEFCANMTQRKDPILQKSSGEDFTCVTFFPDLTRFKMDCLDEDIVALLSKRVYDIAGTNTASGAKLNVYLNGSRIETKNFEAYMGLYQGIEAPISFERVNDRWEIGVGVSDGSFQQVSFVNSICTSKGGCHVNYIVDQITTKLAAVVKKKNKGEEVKTHQIKNHLSVFVNALIVNPAFDSQTKENLTTKASAFGSTCSVSEKMMKQIEKSGIIDNILNWAKFKQTAELKKKSGSKRSKLVGIIKLDDANFAGTSKSNQCTLILTEGDSAKALAISGLGVVGRDFYGVFPLKGKLLNVREASHQQIMKNEEIQNITNILGLTFGKTYTDTSSLRYGHLMIMTDQDHDGSHIKGLLINFLHHFWPSLLQISGFLQQFITPIVKCMKGKKEITFFTIPEYQNWREENDEGKGWRIKYYKGLGTSTAAEAKEYFSNLRTHEIDFEWDDKANDMIDMAFAKKRVEDRKLWLLSMEAGVHIDYNVDRISYDKFVNHELILFSHADNERSIAHFMDGLKPSQRKVLFSCFKRNLKQEIKVAQLAGYISEHSAYHHGEASLTQTIIGMAQNYIGSNNINLLSPCGQFGTRLMGGKDAASPRYVFTKLESITRMIFHPHDDALLEYLEDDGQSIEPLHYVPIIPMALVNGSEGIGTGWSSSIPTYNPRDIIENLKLLIAGEEPNEMKPWYRGFNGDVISKVGKDANNFTLTGIIEQVNDTTVVITELPVGKWTTDYKQYLESVLIGGPAPSKDASENGPAIVPFIKDFKENHTDTSVLFTITLAAEKLIEIVNDKGGLIKKFKLEGSVATSNMNMFDLNSQIRKFESPLQVMTEFYGIRMQYYDRRKMNLTEKLTEEWEKLDNKMRFVLAVINGKLVISNRKKQDLMQDLQNQGFKTFYEKKSTDKSNEDEESMNDKQLTTTSSSEKGYDYLLSMKIWSLTMEKVQDLIEQRNMKKNELDELVRKSAEDLWLEDLDALENSLEEFEAAINEELKKETAARKKATQHRNDKAKGKNHQSSKQQSNKGIKSKKNKDSDDDNDDDDTEEEELEDSDFEEKPKKNTSSKPKQPTKTTSKPSSNNAITSEKAQSTMSKFITTASHISKAEGTVKPSKPINTTSTKETNKLAGSNSTTANTVNTNTTVQKSIIKYTAAIVPPVVIPIRKEEEIRETMSLADRLKLKKTTEPALTSSIATKPHQYQKVVDLCDDDDEINDDIFKSTNHNFSMTNNNTTTVSSRVPVRAVAAKPKSYAIDSDDEDDIHDLSDFEEEKVTKKNNPKKNVESKKSKVIKNKDNTTNISSPSSKVVIANTTAGVKRSAKSTTTTSSTITDLYSSSIAVNREVFSPGAMSPLPTKKTKNIKSIKNNNSSNTVVLHTNTTNPTTTIGNKKVQLQKKVSKKPIKDDSDEEAEFDDSPVRPTTNKLSNNNNNNNNKSPKPIRVRKVITYNVDESSEEEEEDFDSHAEESDNYSDNY